VSVAFSNFFDVVWTENTWCVFRVKTPFSNFSAVVWTGPPLCGVDYSETTSHTKQWRALGIFISAHATHQWNFFLHEACRWIINKHIRPPFQNGLTVCWCKWLTQFKYGPEAPILFNCFVFVRDTWKMELWNTLLRLLRIIFLVRKGTEQWSRWFVTPGNETI